MADSTTENPGAGQIETKADFKIPHDFCKNWMSAIEMAGNEEKDWRADAQATLDRYRLEKSKRAKNYNILYANTQTTVPALYNSEPLPDIRRRFAQKDPVGELASTILERALVVQCEMYDFDSCMKAAVKDRQLQGRGITRVRVVVGENGSKSFQCEPVIWDDYRRGPAKRWDDVPWEAFRHKMTRDELTALNETRGADINLDIVVGDNPQKDKNSNELPDMFKRAEVWEIWDKGERKVYWIAKSDMERPLRVDEDPYNLRKFSCTPRPLYAIESTDTLVPVCEYIEWQPLAEEMDTLTKRISAIVAAAKWRGIYDGALKDAVDKMSNLDDGFLAHAEDAARVMQQGAIDKAIWIMPVEGLTALVKELYASREACKQQIYEITGVADILRGSTKPSETATAQQIKAQWGSLRLQEGQREIQRYARDLFRMLADLMADQLTLPEFIAMTGVELPPDQPLPQAVPGQKPPKTLTEQLEDLLKSDLQREFMIEIETDSTIRADLQRDAENVNGFIQGLGGFFQSVAAAGGLMPPHVAVALTTSFTRRLRLGREVQRVLDDWEKQVVDQAKQPQPQKPSPEEQKMMLEQQKMQLEGQRDDKRLAMEAQSNEQKLGFEREKHVQEMAFKQAEREQNIALQRENNAMQAQQHRESLMSAEASKQQDRAHDADMKSQDRAAASYENAQNRESTERVANEGNRNARRLARMKPKAAGETESEQLEAQLDESTPDQGNGLVESIKALAESIAQSSAQQSQAIAKQGEDLKQGLGSLAQAVLADTEIVRGPDNRPIGARKRPPARMN